MPKALDFVQSDPPQWLVKALTKHQYTHGGWCSCTYENLTDATRSPKNWVHFSPSHQAAEIHKVLSEAVLSLMNGEKK